VSILSRRIAALEASLPPQPSPGGGDLSFLSDEELEAILAAHLRGRDEGFELIRTIVEATAAREGAIN
jgi:hypothetical protein